MERNDKSIQILIEKIISLLKDHNECSWADFLDGLLHKYMIPEMRESAIKDILNMYKGGMGSFMDLVLQKDFKMFVDANNELAGLKSDLYQAVLKQSAAESN